MKRLTIFAVLISAFLGLVACHSVQKFSSRNPAGEKPRHLIVSIHGIAGKENTFGALLPALKEHLEEVDPQYKVLTANFVYATGTADASVTLFGQEFTKFMRLQFEAQPITSQDQISIVAHSQGGLITTFWYSEALENKNSTDYAIALQVKSIVTESTPFWGSKGAYLAYDKLKFPVIRKIIQKLIKMSPGELKELSFGSESIYRFFQASSIPPTPGSVEKHQVRMLNLAGIFPDWESPFLQGLLQEYYPHMTRQQYEALQKEFFKIFNVGTRWESDSVVNTPSARIGFLYSVDLGDYKKDKRIEASSFQTSKFLGQDVPLQLIETVHASHEANRLLDIAYVPERCMQKDQCDHPSYKTIFKHIANCDRENSTCDKIAHQSSIDALFHGDTSYGMNEHTQLMSQMQTFSIAINLHLPDGYKVKRQMLNNDDVDEYIRPGWSGYQTRFNTFFNEDKDGRIDLMSPDQIYKVYLGRRGEAYSRVIKYFPEINQLRFQFTGKVQPHETSKYSVDEYKKMSESGFIIKIKITLPGLKDRWVEVPVKPTYLSFVDLEMR